LPLIAQVAADIDSFVGPNAQRATQIAADLARTQAGQGVRIDIVPGVELRSSGSMTLATDWNLMPASGRRVGAAPTLTLRAAGDLVLANSLSDGFSPVAGSTTGQAINLQGVPTAEGASYRFVAGADLGAAQPMQVSGDAAAGQVTIGRVPARAGSVPPTVILRTTTGTIDIAAAGEIRQLNSQARVVTSGLPVDGASLAGFDRLSFGVNQLQRGATTGSVSGPFYQDAGAITLRAGGSIVGAPGTTYNATGQAQSAQYATDWWYRLTSLNSDAQPVALWARLDLFAQGFASFGGGDITARAGGDIRDLEMSTPTTGYRIGAGVDAQGQPLIGGARWFSGGTLDVAAGGDVVSGLYNAGGAQARLVAGGSIQGAAETGLGKSHPTTQLLYLDTDWQVRAQGDVTIARPINPALLPPVVQGPGGRADLIDGLAVGANLQVASLTGSIDVNAGRPVLVSSDTRFRGIGSQLQPDHVQMVAHQGSIAADTQLQRPSGAASLELLARGDVSAQGIQRAGPDGAAAPQPMAEANLAAVVDTVNKRWNAVGAGEGDARTPVHMVSLQSDVRLDAGSVAFSTLPLRLVAARDIVFNDSMLLQHQPVAEGHPAEATLLQAGRDIRFGSSGTISLGGPGSLALQAGRDISLGGGPGLVTTGNQNNPLALPAGGADITVAAGVRMADGDYRAAVAQQFHLLGAGLHYRTAELAVQMEERAAGRPLLQGQALAAAARAFDALPAEQRAARVRALVGDAAFDATVRAEVEKALLRIDGLTKASDALLPAGSPARVPGSQFVAAGVDAAAVRERLREALSAQALGEVLAQHLQGARFDTGSRDALVASVAPYAGLLLDHMRQQGLGANATLQEAASAFAALPVDRQVPLLNQVLFAELREAGRAAATGERVAYLRAYDALDALFPGARDAAGINLAASQLKTQQGGSITLLAPGGGINVGELGAAGVGKSASELGIVTVAGGDIGAAVRDNLDVNQSRVFTLARGNVLLWSGLGNLDAGRGAKTVTGSPPPIFTINDKGQLVVDTSGSFSGSGIAVLDAGSALDLYAPMGEINAGDAGIQSRGTTFLGANRVVNADALNLSGPAVGAPPPPPTSSATASLGANAQSATSAGKREAGEESDEDKRKKRRARRNLLLDFLGFGERGG
jgi:Filamentous haemagglutinin family outer membrane protein